MEKKKNVLVSACLLGFCCRYDGKGKKFPAVEELMDLCNLIPVCPEQMGGLTTPRKPAEQRGDKVAAEDGSDVTKEYRRGAEEAVKAASLYGCRYALLKERSPSCGSGKVYDGTFSRTLIEGDGRAAAALKSRGVMVFGESRIEDLKRCLLQEFQKTANE